MLEINKFDRIIAANWKLNGSNEFLEHYFNHLDIDSLDKTICGIICPPNVFLHQCYNKSNFLYLGAQDCSKFDSGAYTGEVSAFMLKESHCQFCIVGHSEKREIFKQTSEEVSIKAEKLINQDINPIICIGETLDAKNKGITKEILSKQLNASLPLNSSPNEVIIAYEPIWAIGSGLTPSLDEINEIHSFLKNDIESYKNYKIIYGGSVKANNSNEIMNLENVDGVLVGGASLNPKDFKKILEI